MRRRPEEKAKEEFHQDPLLSEAQAQQKKKKKKKLYNDNTI